MTKATPFEALRLRLLLAFGLIASICTLAIAYYVVHARQQVGADYTAMVADVVRAQEDPGQLQIALDSLASHPEPLHLAQLGELLRRIPRRIENIRIQLLRSDLPADGYASLLEELDHVERLLPTLTTTLARHGSESMTAEQHGALLELGMEIEESLAWSYSELNQLLHQVSADQRRLMERLTLAVALLLVLLVIAVGAVMLMLLRLHRQREAMRHQSRTDELTGLFNRRRLHEVAEQEIDRRRRHAAPLSFMLLDLDHFKQINDAYGHPAGDEVLADFADILRRQVRRIDTVARMGGEEFAVLLPNTDLEAAERLAQRICETIRTMILPGRAAEHGLTISIGVAEANAEEGFDSLYKRTDQRLYRAKAEGRDRVISR